MHRREGGSRPESEPQTKRAWCGGVGDTITGTGYQEGHMKRDDQRTPHPPPDESARPSSEDAWTVFIIGLALLLVLKMA